MKEYKITFAKDIKGDGPDNFVTFAKKGDTENISESTLQKLLNGETITSAEITGHGMSAGYSYDKNDLEPDYLETEVIINYKNRRFRQSKK